MEKDASLNLADSNEQYELGKLYNQEKDYLKAFYWWNQSAKLGNSLAQYELARCYELGRGVKKNIKKALVFYQSAMALGNLYAEKRYKEIKKGG